MSSLPQHYEIIHALEPITDKYFVLGIQLKLKNEQLKIIENDHKGDQKRCLIETIFLWQQNNTTGECSWSALAEAVERVGGHDKLVQQLRKRDIAKELPMEADSKSDSAPSGDLPGSKAESRCAQFSEDTGYSSNGDSASGDSSGSEIEHFDTIPGCGCDDPCSIYTLCAKRCPKPTRTKVGVVRKRVQGRENEDILPSEEELEEEDYADSFEKETRKMREQFAGLVSDTCNSLKKRNVAIADLVLFLQNVSPLTLKPKMDEMSKATSLAQVLRIVTGHTCSWFDYEMMAVLINRFGDKSDKKRLKQYETNFKKFAEQRLPSGNKHIKVGSGGRCRGKQLVVKIDKEWNEATFSDLNKIRGNLASILGVRRTDLYLADIREGCIMMTFMITEELARELFPAKDRRLTPFQVKSLKDKGVKYLRCVKVTWRFTGSTNAKKVSQS